MLLCLKLVTLNTHTCTHAHTLMHTVYNDLVNIIFHNVVSFKTHIHTHSLHQGFLNTILYEKEPGFLGEMLIPGPGQRKY